MRSKECVLYFFKCVVGFEKELIDKLFKFYYFLNGESNSIW